jgi:hypothetical protein
VHVVSEPVQANRVQVDIPCDVQQRDGSGHPWAFLDEARDPSRIVPGAIVVSGDEEDPVVARVLEVTPIANGVRVRLKCFRESRPSTQRLSSEHTFSRHSSTAGHRACICPGLPKGSVAHTSSSLLSTTHFYSYLYAFHLLH